MKIIEFTGDPMVQLEKFDNMDELVFYLNDESVAEINSYSVVVTENIPEYFSDIKRDYILLAEGGIDEEGNEFPDTYIAIGTDEKGTKIAGIYASDFQYRAPMSGEEILLKKNKENVKSL